MHSAYGADHDRQKVRLIRHRLLNTSYLMGFSVRRITAVGGRATDSEAADEYPARRRGHGRRGHGQDHHRSPARGPARRSVRRGRRLPPAGQHRQDVGRHPADDDDRRPWLDAIGALGARPGRARRGGQLLGAKRVVPRPAAGRARPAWSSCTWPATARSSRTGCRTGRGTSCRPALLDSQFATLQPLQADEAGVVVDVSGDHRGDHRTGRGAPCSGARPAPPDAAPPYQQGTHRDQTQRRDAGSGRPSSRSPRPATPSWASPSCAGIAVIVLLITRFKLHAFLALTIGSLAARRVRRAPARQDHRQLHHRPRRHRRRRRRADRARRDPRQAARRLRRRRPDRRHDPRQGRRPRDAVGDGADRLGDRAAAVLRGRRRAADPGRADGRQARQLLR